MTVLRTRYQKHVISVLGAYCYYHLGESIIIYPRSNEMNEFSSPSKRDKREMQTVSHGLSNCFGAVLESTGRSEKTQKPGVSNGQSKGLAASGTNRALT